MKEQSEDAVSGLVSRLRLNDLKGTSYETQYRVGNRLFSRTKKGFKEAEAEALRTGKSVKMPNKLWDMDDKGKVLLAGYKRKRIAFQEIAQTAVRKDDTVWVSTGKYRDDGTLILNEVSANYSREQIVAGQKLRRLMSDDQLKQLDDMNDAIKEIEKWLMEIGADPDDIMGRVTGRYHPNLWKYMEDQELMTHYSGRRPAAGEFYERSRYHELASDAVEKGFSGDPAEAMEILFRSQYRRAADKIQMDLFATQKGKHAAYFKRDLRQHLLDRKLRHDIVKTHLTGQAMDEVMKAIGRDDFAPGIAFGGETGYTQYAKEYLGKTGIKAWMTLLRPDDVKKFEFLLDGNVADYATDWVEQLDMIARIDDPQLRRLSLDVFKEETAKEFQLLKAEMFEINRASNLQRTLRDLVGDDGGRQFAMSEAIDLGKFKAGDFVNANNPGLLLKNLKDINRKQIAELRNALRQETPGWLQKMSSTSAALRSLKTGLDFGVQFIHGLPVFLTNPTVWGKSVHRSIQAFADPTGFSVWLSKPKNWETYQKMLRTNHVHGGGADFVESLRKGGYLNTAASALESMRFAPGRYVGKGAKVWFKAAERQFNGYLLSSKILMHQSLDPMATHSIRLLEKSIEDGGRGLLKGSDQWKQAEQAIWYEFNDTLAKMTGTMSMANMGISPTGQQVAGSMLMFAPRYRLATISFMTKAFSGGMEGEIARGVLGNMMASGLLFYTTLAHKLNQTPKLDPRKGDFLTIRIGDSNVGFGSAFVSLARFGVNIVSDSIEKPGETLDPRKIMERDNPMGRFLRGQTAPLVSMNWDFWSGRDFMGDPTRETIPDLVGMGGNQLLPFFLQNVFDSPRKGMQLRDRVMNMGSEFMGLRAFPTSLYKEAVADADVMGQKKYGLNWDQLDKLQRKKVLAANPRIQKLMDENNEIWAGRGAEYSMWRSEINTWDQEVYDDKLEQAIENFKSGLITPKAFLKRLGSLNFARRLQRERVSDKYPEVIERMAELKEEPPEDDEYIKDVALDEYYNNIIGGNFRDPVTDEFLFDDYERALSDFRESWSDNIYAYIQQVLEVDQDPLLKELYNGREALKGYWRVAEGILEKTNHTDRLGIWDKYNRALKPEKALLEQQNPWIKELVRARDRARILIREQDPNVDAFLFRWGYSQTLYNPTHLMADPFFVQRTPVNFGRSYGRALDN